MLWSLLGHVEARKRHEEFMGWGERETTEGTEYTESFGVFVGCAVLPFTGGVFGVRGGVGR